MPRTLKNSSPVSDAVSRRFFLALDALVDKKAVDSLASFCILNGLSDSRYRAMRLQHGVSPKPGYTSNYKNIQIEALYVITAHYPVSAEWLLTGRGNMLTKKL